MIIIDCTPAPVNKGLLSDGPARAARFLEEAFSATSELKAQEKLIQSCARAFSNKYTLLKNVPLPELDEPVPLVLIGPPGIFVMGVSGIKGVYRAKEESWLEMESKKNQFQPATPNLLQRVVRYRQAVEEHLQKEGLSNPELHALLIFTNPGVHIESTRPAVRILLIDGLGIFLHSINQRAAVYEASEVKRLVAFFKNPQEADLSPAARDTFDFREEAEKKPVKNVRTGGGLAAADVAVTRNLVGLSNKVRLTTKQWIIIGILLVFQILLLMGILMLILMSY
jgi:hypothetical protein